MGDRSLQVLLLYIYHGETMEQILKRLFLKYIEVVVG